MPAEKPRLLVVDDHPHICRLLALQLQDTYDVETATGFDEAITKARSQFFAGTVLDIDLGEARSGADLLRALRQIPHQQLLPALACTVCALPDSRERFMKEGFDGYVGKPLRKDQLLAGVASILGYTAQEDPDEADEEQSDRNLSLPPLPTTFAEIIQLLSRVDPVPDTDQLVAILTRDSIMSSWVMRHVNSAYYSLIHKIPSIERAVAMLGFDPVCNLILTQIMTKTFAHMDSPKAVLVYRHLMRSSVATAAFSSALAYHVGLEKPEAAFTAGLMHQLGRLVMLSNERQRYVDLWEKTASDTGEPYLVIDPEAELKIYGADYARLGADVGRAWHMPDHLLMAIRYHQQPRRTHRKQARLLMLTVAAGYEAAVDLLEPEAVRSQRSQQRNGEPAPLTELARTLKLKEEKLDVFMKEQREAVHALANSIASA